MCALKRKSRSDDILSIHDAMENLSKILEIDLDTPSPIGIVQNRKFVIESDKLGYRNVDWFNAENPEELLGFMRRVYGTVLEHLNGNYVRDEVDWTSPKVQKGIRAIMVLVGESAEKLDRFRFDIQKITEFPSLKELKEYQALQKFYLSKMSEKQLGAEGDSGWESEWLDQKDALLLDTEKTGLKDFETVRRDTEYEMFYMSHEDGSPYFSPKLFRNIKLVCDFDESAEMLFEEDPLLKMRSMLDRDLQASALQILHGIAPLSQEFFRRKTKAKPSKLLEDTNQSLMALMLAANTRNLIQNSMGKSSIDYFRDFQYFLSEALDSEECQKWIAYPPKSSDKLAHCLLDIVFTLSHLLFTRLGGVKQEMTAFIHLLVRKGEEVKQKNKMHIYDSKSPWVSLLEEDDSMRLVLKGFPNGPLFKILDILRTGASDRAHLYFSPIYQKNLPTHLFDIFISNSPIKVLRLPCPTFQSQVERAKILHEFQCFLRNIEGKQILIFNLQDRTAWKENARCQNIEKLQHRAEFSDKLTVITLAKDGDFYHQVDAYVQINDASAFQKLLIEQIDSAEDCGFFFPKDIEKSKLMEFVKKLVPLIHKEVFKAQKSLNRAERLDFIEIFYQFLILKVLEWKQANFLSFTCKDALDTGAMQTSIFYLFSKILSEGKTSKEDIDYFRWLSYAFALMVRERPVDAERFNRAVSAISILDEVAGGKPKQHFKELINLYDAKLFKSLKIETQKISRN